VQIEHRTSWILLLLRLLRGRALLALLRMLSATAASAADALLWKRLVAEWAATDGCRPASIHS
jgi:hypothetical protein